MAALAEILTAAWRHQQTGDLHEAERLYRQVIQAAPSHADAWCLLGVVCQGLGRLADAEVHLRQAIQIMPEHPSAMNFLGAVLAQQGKIDEAASAFLASLRFQPRDPEAWNNLGLVRTRQQRLEESAAHFRQALDIQPPWPEAHYNLANTLYLLGNLNEAIAHYCEAIRLRPEYGLAHLNLGTVCLTEGKLAEARAGLERALQLLPGSTEARAGLAAVLLAEHRFKEAKDILGVLDASTARDVYLKHLDGLHFTTRLHEFDLVLEQARSLLPNDLHLEAALLYRLHFDETVHAAALSDKYRQWSAKHFKPAKEGLITAATWSAQDRIRIAYVGAYLHHNFMENILRNHDHERFEVFVLTDDVRVDLARAYPGTKVYPVRGTNIAAFCRELAIQIAVDLVGPFPFRGAMNQLTAFQQRLAPIQCLWIATINTTGSAAYDYLIADAEMIGPEQECLYVERIARLPDVWLCWTPPAAAYTPGPLPARRHGTVTFGSANRAFKMNAGQLRTWAQVLARCPGSRFQLKGPGSEDNTYMDRFCAVFAEYGVGSERILRSPNSPFPTYLEFYQDIDISLDTYPYNGGITTLESLWMGVPVVSRCGQAFTSRYSRSYLCHLGCSTWVAESDEEYVQRACSLAADLDLLERDRQTLRGKLLRSTICNGPAFTQQLEKLYGKMVEGALR